MSKSGVQLCVTYRTEEAQENVHKLTASLQKERLSANVALNPLSSDDVSEMVDLLYPGSKAPKKLGELLHKKSEGNPFFVQEMTKLLTTRDLKEGVPKKKKVPKAIKSVLQRRMGLLDPGEREILSCGALVGEEFEFEVLQTALGRAPMEVMEAVEAGTRAYIVRESPGGKEERYRFTHSLMADVLYSGIGKVRRKLWHSKVGDALEQHYADRLEVLNGRLTHHFELAESWEKAFTYALASARHAKDTYANAQAVANYRRALGALESMGAEHQKEHTGELLALHEGLGDVLIALGKPDVAVQHFRAMLRVARREGRRTREAAALWGLSGAMKLKGDYQQVVRTLKMSLKISRDAGDTEGVTRSLWAIGDTALDQGMLEEALEHLEESLVTAKRTHSDLYISKSLHGIAWAAKIKGEYDDALAHLEESLRAAEGAQDSLLLSGILVTIGIVHMEKGSLGQASKYIVRALKIARESGHLPAVAGRTQSLGSLRYFEGNYDDALKCYQEALRLFRRIGDKARIAANLHNVGLIYFVTFSTREALGYFGDALRMQRQVGNKEYLANHMLHLGACYSQMNLYARASKYLAKAENLYKEMGHKWGMAAVLSWRAHNHGDLRGPESALELYELRLSLVRELGNREDECVAMTDLAGCLLDCGSLSESLRTAEEALAIAPSASAKVKAMAVIAGARYGKGDKTGANQILNGTSRMSEELKGNIDALRVLMRMRVFCLPVGRKLPSAIELLRYAEKAGRVDDIVYARRTIGKELMKKGDLAGATEHYHRAEQTVRRVATQIGDARIREKYIAKPEYRDLFAELKGLEGKKPRKAKS